MRYVPTRRGSRGQALIIAVLVLFAVATLAALFAALIGSQLTQVTRQSDLVALRNIAEAGLRLANEELTYSAEGADWRPSPTAYRCGAGQVRIDITYGPAPDQLQSRFLRIVSTAIFPDNPFLRHTILALKPVLLTDYARFITDRFETNRAAGLGVTGLELGGQERPDYIYRVGGPIRSNTDLLWYGRAQVILSTTFDTSWRDLGMLRDDRIEIAGQMARASSAAVGDTLELVVDGVSRVSDLFNPQSPEQQADYPEGFPQWETGQVIPNSRTVLSDLPEILTMNGETLSAELSVPRVRPPEIDAVHPDKDTNRYLLLTRDAGNWLQTAEAFWYNTGWYGWGWSNFGGIYVDNFSDIQYNHDLEKLRLNWVRSVGAHQTLGDARVENTKQPPEGPADWWDKTGRYYAPPGAEIILHGDDPCPWVEIVRHDLRGQEGSYFYWQEVTGTPISATDPSPVPDELIYPFEAAEGTCTPFAGSRTAGIYDGNRAAFPFSANGVIYIEGNVRIRGIMPPVRDSQGRIGATIPPEDAPEAYFSEWSPDTGRTRRFDLQVVSGGTIYVEGDLLSPGSAGLIPDDYTSDRLYGARIALLARDYVCVNTTALNPRPVDMLTVPPPTNNAGEPQYYNDLQRLYPPGGYSRYALFRGIDDPSGNAVRRIAPPTELPVSQKPDVIMAYHNPRFSTAWLGAEVTDARLMLGHSGVFYTTPNTDISGPPPGSGELVDVEVRFENSAGSALYPWQGNTSRYTFLQTVSGGDQSDHWYDDQSTPNDYNEILPVTGIQDMPVIDYLTGEDFLRFTTNVTPVSNPDPPPLWIVDPMQLGYLLGPVAIAPPREADPLPVEIEALVYAQNGSWFIIPGAWFNEDPDELGQNPTVNLYPGYHEPLNIRLSFYGAITENMPADLGSVAEWTSKWSGPTGRGEEFFLTYGFDPLLRFPRRETEDRVGYLRFPNFPITSDLVIWGERVTGPAGT